MFTDTNQCSLFDVIIGRIQFTEIDIEAVQCFIERRIKLAKLFHEHGKKILFSRQWRLIWKQSYFFADFDDSLSSAIAASASFAISSIFIVINHTTKTFHMKYRKKNEMVIHFIFLEALAFYLNLIFLYIFSFHFYFQTVGTLKKTLILITKKINLAHEKKKNWLKNISLLKSHSLEWTFERRVFIPILLLILNDAHVVRSHRIFTFFSVESSLNLSARYFKFIHTHTEIAVMKKWTFV